MNTPVSTPYTTGAYQSNSCASLPLKPAKSANRSGLFTTPLAFGNYANLEPAMEVTTQLQGEEHTLYERQHKEGDKEEIYCDARRWSFHNSSRVPYVIFIANIMSFPFTWFIWWVWILAELLPTNDTPQYLQDLALLVALLVFGLLFVGPLALYMTGKRIVHPIQIIGFFICAGIVFYKTGAFWGPEEMHTALWGGALLYFLGAIGFDCLLWLYSKVFTHDGSEFNRTDGMLRFKRRFRPLFVAPFEEFDPVLQRLPSGHGSHDYALWLHHRYTKNKICLVNKVHAMGLDRHNALAFWDCLQRYMDITQPLPDLPVLEQSRHLDPVTAAHDALVGRNPRRWRDQSQQDWQANGVKQLTAQLQQHPWQTQRCIIKARIDPALSIEAYYRAQEAKGIRAPL